MQEDSGVTNLQTELNYLDLFKSYCNSSDFGFLSSGGGTGGWGCLGWSAIVYMSSGMFRGKESSNRIKLSRLVQELLNIGVSGSLQLWGWRVVGGCPPHMCTHMCMHAHACTHMRMVNMIISCKWPPPLGESLGIPYDVICTCVCVHMHACACMCTCVGAPFHHPLPTYTQPPDPRGDPQNQSKFIMGGWVGGWVDGWGQVKTLKI